MAVNKASISPKLRIGRFFEPSSALTEVGLRSQARLAAALSMGAGFFYFLGSIGSYFGSGFSSNVIELAIVGGTCIAAYILCRSKYVFLGSSLLVGSITISTYFFVITGTNNPILSIYTSLPIALIIGSVLLPLWGMAGLIAINIIAILIIPTLMSSLELMDAITIAGTLGVSGVLLIIVSLIRSSIEQQRLKETKSVNSELGELRVSLERQVNERTLQVRVASEISRQITSSMNLDELLNKTVQLIHDNFNYYNTSIFLLDETHQHAVLRASAGSNASELIDKAYRIPSRSDSLIGWVLVNRQPRLIADTSIDSLFIKEELLPDTKSEVSVPILFGSQVLGVLDIQDNELDSFDEETVSLLFTLGGTIATALRNASMLETKQENLLVASQIYQESTQIINAKSVHDIYIGLQRVFEQTPYSIFFMLNQNDTFNLVSVPIELSGIGLDQSSSGIPTSAFPFIEPQIVNISAIPSLPHSFLSTINDLNIASFGIIPVLRNSLIKGVMLIGSQMEDLALGDIRPFLGIADLVISVCERVEADTITINRLREIESISEASRAFTKIDNINELYSTVHEYTRQRLGDINFIIALYDSPNNSIMIPYLYEKGKEITQLETYPLGEGLISILIQTKQPLLIVEDTERRTAALGAKIVGQAAKSWMGTPLVISGEVLGAIIVQDAEKEFAFDETDLSYIITLASQVAGILNNARLFAESQKRALQLQTASEIARDISGSLDLNELLSKSVALIRERFNYYHSAIFLVDADGEYAVIKEATGEAGIQMKRASHKLKVGSKSIVGYVTSSGEPLIVSDTSRDATYYSNPLLPDTRAEIAIPLKVGGRILGALDVQSVEPYSFTPDDINVLRILADQLAIAVLNTELFAETQEHLSQHRLLHHVTTAAASGTTLEEALDSAVQGLQVTLGGDRVSILLLDKNKQQLEVVAVAGYSDEIKKTKITNGEGITGWVVIHQQSQRVDDVLKDKRYIQVGYDTRSELAIPLIYRGEVLGVLNVESDQPDAYNENDEELLGTLCGSLAAIISNARLIEQIRTRSDRERLLYEVTTKIRRSTDIQSILATTTTELSKVLGARRAEIHIDVGANPDEQTMTIMGITNEQS